MASSSPNPDPTGSSNKRSGVIDGYARTERLLQIAFILPASLVVGWLIGAGLDKWLHQNWIYIAGIIVGFIAGMVELLRSATNFSKQLDREDRKG